MTNSELIPKDSPAAAIDTSAHVLPPEQAADQAEAPASGQEPLAPAEDASDAAAAAEPGSAAPSSTSAAELATGPAPVSAPVAQEEPVAEEPQESFADLLKDFERTHTHRAVAQQLQGTVVSISADQVFLDIGYKIEGALARSLFPQNAEGVKPGDRFPVSITGRNEEGYYQLSMHRVALPRDWSALEAAFAEKVAIAGTVTGVVKGGLTVDVGVRAFMPASRSGTREAAEMEALVGQQITCRITKLDTADEDVVVDRRVVLEEEARGAAQSLRAALNAGDTVTGTVRTIMPYGAFISISPGIDGLLHVSDISLSRVNKPEDVLTVGDELTLRILKIDPGTGKISLGLKQMQPAPWETAATRFQPGQRVSGAVTRLADFGAFVEIEPGLEGLIHISEMSWAKKVRHPSDLLKIGDRVDAVILSIKPPEESTPGRIALGLKQTLADPWLEVQRDFPVGAEIEGPVTRLTPFGAFVQIAEGVDGLVHISEMVADRRLNHPSEVVRVGQRVKAQVLAIDSEKRQMKLSMKQLIPTGLDEFLAEHKVGEIVSGRVVDASPKSALVELGEGIRAACRMSVTSPAGSANAASPASPAKPDLGSLSAMLKDRWKGNAPAQQAQPEPLAEGQVRAFKITKLDADAKKIEVELA